MHATSWIVEAASLCPLDHEAKGASHGDTHTHSQVWLLLPLNKLTTSLERKGWQQVESRAAPHVQCLQLRQGSEDVSRCCCAPVVKSIVASSHGPSSVLQGCQPRRQAEGQPATDAMEGREPLQATSPLLALMQLCVACVHS